jgi:hypothetical protein
VCTEHALTFFLAVNAHIQQEVGGAVDDDVSDIGIGTSMS